MNKRFAIFDMDGTLTDSMGYWADLAGEFLAAQGVGVPSQEVLDRIVPLTMEETAAVFAEEYGLTLPPDAMARQMIDMMKAHYRTDVPLKPGVREYLDTLEQQGVQMCIASATAEDLVKICLRRLGVRDKFRFILSCETMGVGKDRPDIYLEAARRFGAEPKDAAVFEDAIYAAQTAKDAGFYLVGVYDGSAAHSWPQLQQIADELIIEY